ncbi:DUF6992 family protein [Phototrophicus methaneseepsis]|uniref:DUF6992 family protein n=1 Tax=Phototrophicus methaneseepsis TaxID=2710758 RepID=UPI001E6106EC|nr:hypothetical protein [Phototrophicus methaneseepsis]
MNRKLNIWQFQTLLSRRLQNWAVFSVMTGLLMRLGNKYWRGVGGQFIVWGLIDEAIAVFARSSADNRAGDYENPGSPEVLSREARNLRWLLLFNVGLDMLYVVFGRRLASSDNDARQGNGHGIVVQGAFLFFFDLLHAVILPRHKD